MTEAITDLFPETIPAPPPAQVERTLAEFESWLYANRRGDDGNFSEQRTEVEQALFALWRFLEEVT